MKISLGDGIGDSKFFSWKDALFLPRWGVCAFPANESIVMNIERMAKKMDEIRDFFNAPITITSWYRPLKYNAIIGGAMNSAHIQGLAVDFLIKDLPSIEARQILKHKLLEFNIRLERLETPHVHIDIACADDLPLAKRFFNP